MAPNHQNKTNMQGLRPEQMPTIKVTKRLDRSVAMFLLHTIIRPFGSKLTTPKKTLPGGSLQLEAPKSAGKKIEVSERKVDDIYIYDIKAKKKDSNNVAKSEKRPTKRLYYFGGGGWQMLPSGEHWSFLAELAIQLPDTAISLVSYPLAPHSPAPVAFPMLMKLYRTIMLAARDNDEEVILAGDSAGGNIILALLVNALIEDESSSSSTDNVQPCPKAVLAISPSTDLRRGNADIASISKSDPLLRPHFINSTAQAWRGDWDPRDIRVSPLYADLKPIARRGVKVHGVCGRYDILSPDAVLFREKCNLESIEGEWLDWEKQMHCFPLAFSFKLRESVEAKEWIVDVLRRV